MFTSEQVLAELQARANLDQLGGMARHGMSVERRLGVKVPELRKLARRLGKDHRLALALWDSGIDDARILASMVDEPDRLDEAQMDAWVGDFNSWDVCDQVCMNLFENSPLAWSKIREWARRDEEYVKRAAFALIACLAWHDRQARDEQFAELLPVIEAGATDERNYVKKAVSWALRNVGKRNPALHAIALGAAEQIGQFESRAARWIARDVMRDLNSDATRRRLAKMQG